MRVLRTRALTAFLSQSHATFVQPALSGARPRVARALATLAQSNPHGGDHMPPGLGLPSSSRSMRLPPFTFESNVTLPMLSLGYNTYGKLNATGTNAILVGHSLTSNSCVHEWWAPLLGAGPRFVLDTDRYFIVCVNLLGSVYGSDGPLSRDARGLPYGATFPVATIRDNARAQIALLRELGVKELAAAIGGSLGGMIALETALVEPAFVRSLMLIATCAAHPGWAIALGAAGRAAVFADAKWRDGLYARHNTPPPLEGLAVARQFAMLSYKSPASVDEKFGRTLNPNDDDGNARQADSFADEPTQNAPSFVVESYLTYQGEKFRRRFDPCAYVRMTQLLDSHDVGRSRGGTANALRSLAHRTLVVGIDSDGLYPLQLQRELASAIPSADMFTISSPHGHDSFLIHLDELNETCVAWRDGTTHTLSNSATLRREHINRSY